MCDCVFGQFEDSITQVLQQLQQGIDCLSCGVESHVPFLYFSGDNVSFEERGEGFVSSLMVKTITVFFYRITPSIFKMTSAQM